MVWTKSQTKFEKLGEMHFSLGIKPEYLEYGCISFIHMLNYILKIDFTIEIKESCLYSIKSFVLSQLY